MTKSPLHKLSLKDGLNDSRLLRTLIDSLPEQVYVKDAAGRYVLNNLAHVRALGASSPEEVAGKSDSDFYPEKFAEQYRSDEREVLCLGVSLVDREEPSVDGEGNERWHSTTKVPLRNGDGEIVGLVGVTRDVTERKWAEEALRQSERGLAEAQRMAHLGSWEWNVKTGEVSWSDEVFRIYGHEPGEFEPTLEKLMEVMHPDDRELVRKNIDGAFHEGEPYDFEHRIVRPGGEERVVHRRAEVVVDEEGEPLRMVGTVHDMTERRQAEEKLRESEKRFRSLIQNASDLITILGADGTIRYDSPAFKRVLGYEPEERVGESAFEYVHPNDRERLEGTFAEALDSPGQVRLPVEFRIRHKDGSWRHVETTRTNLLQDPAVEGVVANSRDITERKEAEEALKESEERHRAVVEQSVEGIYSFDPDDGRLLESNKAFEELLGYTSEELLDMTVYGFIAHEREDVERNVERDHRERRRHKGERKYRRKDGKLLDVEVSAAVIPYRDEEAVCCVVHDITERKALEEHLEHQALHDSLTGLPNRALFLDRLGHALARATRDGGSVAVLLLDLNDFKIVNDSMGHDAGNEVLIGVNERLSSCVRPGDTVGRIFGDEFAVLLEAPAGSEEARRVTERIQEGLQEPFEVEGREVFVSSSIGIALSESVEDEPKEVLRHADLAMYEAKSRGKAEYEMYDPSMDSRTTGRMELENDLRRALEREEFEVHYQPVIELSTGEIDGLEALVRWRHPERGRVPAAEFITLVEETGLIRPIGQRVVEEACRQMKEWRERYPKKKLVMCVNLSASQFSRQPNMVPEILNDTGLDPSDLKLEITERAVMDEAEFSIGKMKKLKGLGVSFAIDNFGMGYSCLYYLKRMPVDYLKIDRSFIAGLGKGDPGDEAIVSGTISLAHALGLKVVAEGVETEEQLAKLKELRCDLGQGYRFAKPLPGEGAERLLKEGYSC